MKLTYQDCGSSIALFLEGDGDDIIEKHMSLWNHGATRTELEWVTDTRAYFWTTKKKLLKALVDAKLFHLLGITKSIEEYKGKKKGLLPKARELAEIEFSHIDKVTKQFGAWQSTDYEYAYSSPSNSLSPVEHILLNEHGTIE